MSKPDSSPGREPPNGNPGRVQAEVRLPTDDLGQDLAFFTGPLGFRLDTIYPADNPAIAVLSGHGLRIRLERGAAEAPGTIRLLCENPTALAGGARELNAPNGTRIEIAEAAPPLKIPQTEHSLLVHRCRDSEGWITGRAGMHYRDLIPNRLGGRVIASHIRIPEGGPVPDSVHYHSIGFQMIFCYRGWVRLVYEDQGPPFILEAGDCVLQPPEIRHRVLEASAGLDVVEVAVPAEHVTAIDHEMTLPTATPNPGRKFRGQSFCRHEAAAAVWQPWRIAGFEARDTGMAEATGGLADVRIARRLKGGGEQITTHRSDVLFTFILEGSLTLRAQGHTPFSLAAGDAFVIPPGMRTVYTECSSGLQLLEVALPGPAETAVHEEM